MNTQKIPHQVLAILILALITVLPSTANSTTEIKGLALQEQLREPILYAATRAEQSITVHDMYTASYPLSMEVRYVVDQYSARQNRLLWVGAVLINNEKQQLSKLQDSMLKFSRLMNTRTYKGDRLVFNYTPAAGTEIIFNGVKLDSMPEPEFLIALLNTWFGNRPPSSSFSEAIRVKPSKKQLREFNAISYSPSRVAEIKAIASLPVAPKQESNQEDNTTLLSVTTGKKIEQSAGQSVEQTASMAVASSLANSSELLKRRQSASTSQNKPKAEKPAVARNTKQVEPKPRSKNIAQSKPKPSSTPAESSVVDQIIQVLSRDYQEEAKSYIENNASPVPPIRVRKVPKDKAIVKVTLSRNGNNAKVLKSEIIQGKFNNLLQESLYKSLTKLKSIPPFPDALISKELTFLVELDFSSCKRSTSAWICFK